MKLSSLSEAIVYGSKGDIETWIHSFLNGDGNNSALSKGLKLEPRLFEGPVKVGINEVKRCCGPEPEMEFYNDPAQFNERVERLKVLIADGWDMPPLIVEHCNGQWIIRDGNHRHQAMKELNIEEVFVIKWKNIR